MTTSITGIYGRMQRTVRSYISSPSVVSTSTLISEASAMADFPVPHGHGDQVRRGGAPDPPDKATCSAGEGHPPPRPPIATPKVRSRNSAGNLKCNSSLLCVQPLRAGKEDIAVHVVKGSRQWPDYRLSGPAAAPKC